MIASLLSILTLAMMVVPQDTGGIKPLPPGRETPAIELVTLEGAKVTTETLLGTEKSPRVAVIVFWSCRCPWAIGWDPDLNKLVRAYAKRPDVRFAIVDSNEQEVARPKMIRDYLKSKKYDYPLMLDKGNKLADALGGLATPHAFVIGKDRRIVYSGKINDTPPKFLEGEDNRRHYLREAIEAALKGKAPETPVTPPQGCTIKRVPVKKAGADHGGAGR